MRRLGIWLLAVVLGAGAAASGSVGRAQSPEAAAPRVHEVRPGETLWTISARSLGDPTLWAALYHANRDQIKDPSRVYPGQRLSIPDVPPGEAEALRREAEALAAPGPASSQAP